MRHRKTLGVTGGRWWETTRRNNKLSTPKEIIVSNSAHDVFRTVRRDGAANRSDSYTVSSPQLRFATDDVHHDGILSQRCLVTWFNPVLPPLESHFDGDNQSDYTTELYAASPSTHVHLILHTSHRPRETSKEKTLLLVRRINRFWSLFLLDSTQPPSGRNTVTYRLREGKQLFANFSIYKWAIRASYIITWSRKKNVPCKIPSTRPSTRSATVEKCCVVAEDRLRARVDVVVVIGVTIYHRVSHGYTIFLGVFLAMFCKRL